MQRSCCHMGQVPSRNKMNCVGRKTHGSTSSPQERRSAEERSRRRAHHRGTQVVATMGEARPGDLATARENTGTFKTCEAE
ncbi:hypothetical protein SUGI_0945070 [Cryptomeria japonica]|nr:hypothetical protein SUGI_0945070 [Cryptomeria japonica]